MPSLTPSLLTSISLNKGEKMNTKIESTSSPKRLARIAGVFYLLVAFFGGFAEGFADPKLYVAGNAAATAANVLANPGLVRLSVVAHLLNGSSSSLQPWPSTSCFSTFTKTWRMAMLVFVALAAGITPSMRSSSSRACRSRPTVPT